MAMAQYVSNFDASARLVEAHPRSLIGDASEQTLTFYWAQNMKVRACLCACACFCVQRA